MVNVPLRPHHRNDRNPLAHGLAIERFQFFYFEDVATVREVLANLLLLDHARFAAVLNERYLDLPVLRNDDRIFLNPLLRNAAVAVAVILHLRPWPPRFEVALHPLVEH